MDTRGVQRLLEKIYGLADSAEHVGRMQIEMMRREPRLSESIKSRLEGLYRQYALRVQELHSGLGLAICDSVQDEVEDNDARAQLELMRANLQTLHDAARESLDTGTRK